VHFIELKFPEMGPALQRGTVQAATIAEPALSSAIHLNEARAFADVYEVIAPEFANIVWFTSKSWLQKNPDTAKRLVSGIYATARWSNDHQPQSADILAKVSNGPDGRRRDDARLLRHVEQSEVRAGAARFRATLRPHLAARDDRGVHRTLSTFARRIARRFGRDAIERFRSIE